MSAQRGRAQDGPGTSHTAADPIPPLQLSQDERRILELHDQLRELEIKIALVKAQKDYRPDPSIPDTDESLRSAQEEAAKAKAAWLLRNDIADGVMAVNPILKAVHGSKQATPIESDLLPHLKTRDATSSLLSKTSLRTRETVDALTDAEADTLRTARRNAELATELLALTREAERRTNSGGGGDDRTDPEMEALKAEVKASRQKWKVMKGTVSAMVVGSGVDWVGDKRLRELVLDPEEDV